MTSNYFRDSASSPEAYERLQRLKREYLAKGDMTADRSAIHEAVWEAYPLTDEEREQLERMKRGDYRGMWTRDDNGNWIRIEDEIA